MKSLIHQYRVDYIVWRLTILSRKRRWQQLHWSNKLQMQQLGVVCKTICYCWYSWWMFFSYLLLEVMMKGSRALHIGNTSSRFGQFKWNASKQPQGAELQEFVLSGGAVLSPTPESALLLAWACRGEKRFRGESPFQKRWLDWSIQNPKFQTIQPTTNHNN